jgi:hypothetical protein
VPLGYRAYARLRHLFEQVGPLYRLLEGASSMARPGRNRKIAGPQTDIVIEGFPRSANTFFYWYFDTAQAVPVNVAHHLHSPYQLRTAARYRLPCVFLTRNPLDCAASAILRDPRLSASDLLQAYQALYSTAAKHAHDILIVPQKLAIEDPNFVIGAVNAKYGRDFNTLPEERLPEVYERINKRHLEVWQLAEADPMKLGLPSAEKDAAKQSIVSRVKAKYPAQLERCQHLFVALEELALDPASLPTG